MDDGCYPVFVRLEIEMNGSRDLIDRQVRELTQAMRAEVASRASRRGEAAPRPRLPTGTPLVHARRGLELAREIEHAGAAIERSAGPSGSPDLFVREYARLLDGVLRARDDMRAQTPAGALDTPSAWDHFANGLYDRFATWPDQMSFAADQNAGESLRLVLTAMRSIIPIVRANAADLARVRNQRDASAGPNASLGRDKGCATVIATIVAALFR